MEDSDFLEELEKHKPFLEKESHEFQDLCDWYIASIIDTQEPIWTEKHIEELLKDYWLIPKPIE